MEHGGYCITVFSAPNYCDQMCAPAARRVIPVLAGVRDMGAEAWDFDTVLQEGKVGGVVWLSVPNMGAQAPGARHQAHS